MLTPAEIASKEFETTFFNGYLARSVDDFLESVTTDYTALFKENMTLKAKLKLLVETIEEYRKTEDAMRDALWTAQKKGEEILEAATGQAVELLHTADAEVEGKMRELAGRIADEEDKLRLAREETAKFVKASELLIEQHRTLLTQLDTIRRASEKNSDALSAVPTPRAEEKPVSAPEKEEHAEDEPVKPSRPRPDYSNLQFGVNFTQE